ncbi:rare lipoprotein A [Novosphingobium mathurense]|uniref:Rare lipoprotein A n=1 Tax=Novosphingobium mathurense TaxID=428990 RepID=A0A1U6GY49_9SPHN|nr:rare lipoprotein A [Novosphingobium mathurense]
MRLPVNHALPFAALILLAGCSTGGSDRPMPVSVAPVNGPAADYPVVVGDPFTIGDTTWTPTDQMNYDAVGYAGVAGNGAVGFTAAHKTLPLPSYAEVTSLDTGKTILVRVERRGPMVNDTLMELSRDAAAALGMTPGQRGAVRLRRTNPPETDRALLRQHELAPERMATPEALLMVLRRKLADQSPLLTPSSMPTGTGSQTTQMDSRPSPALPTPAQPLKATSPVKPAPEVNAEPKAAPVAKGHHVVQVAAFSISASATTVARKLNGFVADCGGFSCVRMGPFANRAQAAAALEKARAAGYSDARIQRAD